MSTQSLSSPEQLFALAASQDPHVRGELALAMVEICESKLGLTGPNADVVHKLLCDLVREAARDLRMRLAKKLAAADWAPHELVEQLAQDEIDVAAAVIARSSVLMEADLIAVARERGLEHRVAVASRPNVSEQVTDVVAEFAEPEALTAIIDNPSAQVSRETFETCISAARDHEPLRRPLAQRPELPAELAPDLYAIVGEELRRAIVSRFSMNETALLTSVEEAKDEALERKGSVQHQDIEAAALVERLARSDRLTPSVAVQAAQNGRLELCEHAIARLAGMTVDELRAAVRNGGMWAVALACRASNIPRAAFTVVSKAFVVAARVTDEGGGRNDASTVTAFVKYSRADAMDALRQL